MKYEHYFLTVYDIVHFARSNNILCQGRGSAANSAVCYCLGITEVDPARANLLFERFISKERNEPPDIDVDFEHQRREEVIQYIYNKYGRTRAALAAVVISYRPKSALRDSGRALGVDLGIIEKVCKSHRWFDSKADLLNRLMESGLDPEAPLSRQWATLATQLLNFPRHLSQHPGGFVIAQGKLSRLVPIENAAMVDRSVIQWDKNDLEELGLMKVDVLALGMLSMLRRALELVSLRHGSLFEMQDIPPDDKATYDMICAADTVGVFQIESRAQMSMLPRMKPRVFYDLVIEVAVVRPGPDPGRHGAPVSAAAPGPGTGALPEPGDGGRARAHAGRADLPGAGDAGGDPRRRLHAGGGRPAAPRDGGLEAKGRPRTLLRPHRARHARTRLRARLCRSHLQPDPGLRRIRFSRVARGQLRLARLCQLLDEVPRAGGVFMRFVEQPADGFLLALATGAGRPAPRHRSAAGRHCHQRLGIDAGRTPRHDAPAGGAPGTVAPARHEPRGRGPHRGCARDPPLRERGRPGAAGRAWTAATCRCWPAPTPCVRSPGTGREALWQAVGGVPDKDLLRPTTLEEEIPILAAPSEGDEIVGDYRAQGLTLGRHPVALLRKPLLAQRFMPASVLNLYADGQLARGCGLVTVRQRPGTANGVLFLTLEDETGNVNVIVWPDLVEHQRKEVLGANLLGVYGVWQSQGQVKHLVAKRLVDMSHLLGRLTTNSRDFC